jgi:hypothetical protein
MKSFGNKISRPDPLVIDPYWSNVVYYANYNSATTTDNAGINSPTASGTLTVDTTTKKYGAGSLNKGSGANYLNVGASGNTTFIMGTGDWTVEMWVYLSTAPNSNNFGVWSFNQNRNQQPAVNTGGMDALALTGLGTGGNWKMFWYDGGPSSVQLYYHGGSGSPTTITANAWHHIGACRVSGNLYTFIDGVVYNNGSLTKNFNSTGGSGASNGGGTKLGTNSYNEYSFTCKFDDVRITKGVGRYTANFTPPEKSFPTPTLP